MDRLWQACSGGRGVVAIVNATPDSFYEAGRSFSRRDLAARVEEAVGQGARILDVGGYSTRPGASEVDAEEELRRVSLALETVRGRYPDFPVSIDTFRAVVARAAMERYGDCIINDVTAGQADPDMIPLAASRGVPYIATHMRGTPATMQSLAAYGDVADEVARYFGDKIAALSRAGVEKIVVDPGFGFAKTTEQNYRLLSSLGSLAATGCPVMAGLSRKSMITNVTGGAADGALAGTAALHWEALRQGAVLLRAHDVKAAADVIELYEYYCLHGK